MRIKSLALVAMILLAPFAIYAEESAHGPEIFRSFRLEVDTGVTRRGGPVQSWDFSGWIGGDRDRLVLKTEGKRLDGVVEDADATALYSRNIAEFWDAQIGIRQDFRPHPATYLAAGLEGLAPYYFDTQAHLFISDKGYASIRLRGENDFLLSQRFIIKPYAQVEVSFSDDEPQQRGKGLTKTEFGMQTRYEITRSFAPYIDLHYERAFGRTAKFLQKEGETADDFIASIGIRLLF